MDIQFRRHPKAPTWAFASGFLLLILWFCFSAMSVVPGSDAVFVQWVLITISLFASGAMFGVGATLVILRRGSNAN